MNSLPPTFKDWGKCWAECYFPDKYPENIMVVHTLAPTRLEGLEWERWCPAEKALASIDPFLTKDPGPGEEAEWLPGTQREPQCGIRESLGEQHFVLHMMKNNRGHAVPKVDPIQHSPLSPAPGLFLPRHSR